MFNFRFQGFNNIPTKKKLNKMYEVSLIFPHHNSHINLIHLIQVPLNY